MVLGYLPNRETGTSMRWGHDRSQRPAQARHPFLPSPQDQSEHGPQSPPQPRELSGKNTGRCLGKPGHRGGVGLGREVNKGMLPALGAVSLVGEQREDREGSGPREHQEGGA